MEFGVTQPESIARLRSRSSRVRRRGNIDRLIEHGTFLLGGLGLLSLRLHRDRLIESFDDRLRAVIDDRRRGSLKGEFVETDLGIELDVRIGQPDFAGIDFLDRALGADRPAVRSQAAGFKDR